jgi:hypothetical protein
MNELIISYKDNYIFIKLNTKILTLNFTRENDETANSFPDTFVSRRMHWLIKNPEFLDFIINSYNHNGLKAVDFDTLIMDRTKEKSMQILFFRSKIAMNYYEVISEMLLKLRNRVVISIKLEEHLKNFNIETIVKLRYKEEMTKFFNYDYIENKYPEYYL